MFTPVTLKAFLTTIVRKELKQSVMMWGAAGLGKSSVVAQVATENDLRLVDLRLSQLAPTDLRGLPVSSGEISRWLPPEFLPREGKGILFLDELNMAPPTVQGIAQQLILDRKVGSYTVPPSWFIWAAGNRKEDRASVFDMPAPLGNRFVHVDVGQDFDSWREYAINKGIHEQIIAFLTFRPTLLHKMDAQRPAWPSPRTWFMGSDMYTAGLPISTCIGESAGAEFDSFVALYKNLPDLDAIIDGRGKAIAWPDEPSVRYATTTGLSLRPKAAKEAIHAFEWIAKVAGEEWVQLFGNNLMVSMRSKGAQGELALLIAKHDGIKKFLSRFQGMLGLSKG